jgi:RimJ/RimL family protein N-acetyltransferase
MLKSVVFLKKDKNGAVIPEIRFGRENGSCRTEEKLFVTDSPALLKCLQAEGAYAIGWHHEKNRDAVFEHAQYVVEDVEQLDEKAYDEVYRRLTGQPWDILETEHLKVRESTVADVEEFYRIYKDPSITRYMENLFQDPEEEKAYMEAYIRQMYGFYGFGMWTLLWKETGQVVGRAGLNIREGYDLPELGFAVDTGFQRRGLAYEVCLAILAYARDELSFDRVQALVQEANLPSRGLLEKLGFQYERKVTEKNQEYMFWVKQL